MTIKNFVVSDKKFLADMSKATLNLLQSKIYRFLGYIYIPQFLYFGQGQL